MHLRRAIAGDLDGLDELVARLSPLLLAQTAFRMGPVLRRHHDPEDLVHDAWLVALPRLAELPARDGRHTPVLLRFLTTTVLHRVRNLARKHLHEHEVRGGRVEPDELTELVAEQSGVVTKAVRGESVNAVRAQLDRLDEVDRQIVVLRGIEQQSNQTVGMLLEMEPKTVSKRYHRVLEKLRNMLPGSVFDDLGEHGENGENGGNG